VLSKKILALAFYIILLSLLAFGCNGGEISEQSESYPFPSQPPDIAVPADFELDIQATAIQGQKVSLNSSIENQRFQNCEVSIVGQDLKIENCEFIDCLVYISRSQGITVERVIFKDLNKYEQAALRINDSQAIVVRNSMFAGNFIGLIVHASSAEIINNRFEDNNGHNAMVVSEGSSALVKGNYFYGSYPHAVLILNRWESSGAKVIISSNIIDQTGEDAIDFEDYRNAMPSIVSNNLITNSGWAAVNVEYNSWEANITIQDNWIENTGIDWKLPTHILQPESFGPGWGHGIMVEDSSGVSILNNRILSAGENGVEIANARDIIIMDNGIDCSEAGIRLRGFNESSFHREFSPLMPENAGGSRAKAGNNTIFNAREDYEVDEVSQLAAP
jgi:hypothetical protein